jgi:hypothetical protein
MRFWVKECAFRSFFSIIYSLSRVYFRFVNQFGFAICGFCHEQLLNWLRFSLLTSRSSSAGRATVS